MKPMQPRRPQQFPRVVQTTLEENGRVLYSPSPRMQTPTVINHARLYSEFNGADLHRFGPEIYPHSLYRQSVYCSQNNEGFEAANTRQMMRQPCPRYHLEASYYADHSFQRDNQHLSLATCDMRQEKLNAASSRNDERPRSLWRPEADEHFGGPNRHRYGPATNPPVPYPESEYLLQHKRRIELDKGVHTMAREPYPSYHSEASVRKENLNSVASRNNDGPPRSLWPPENVRCFSSSYHLQPGPYTSPHVPNPESEYLHHDKRRIEIDDKVHTIVRQPFPSYHPEALSRKEHLNCVLPRNECAPDAEECFGGSNRPRSGPYTNPRASNPGNDCIRQDRKRLKMDIGVRTMRQPYPNYYQPEISHPPERSFQRDSQHIFRQENSNPAESINNAAQSRSPPHLEGDGRIRETSHCVAGRDEISHNPDPEIKCIHQDRKRYKVNDGAQLYPAYQLQVGYSFEHCIVPVVGEPKEDKPDSSDRLHLLWVPEDKEHLTELHCFVRKYCVFIFSATKKDVGSELKDKSDTVHYIWRLLTLRVTLVKLRGRAEKRH